MTEELREVEAALAGSAAVHASDYLRWTRSADLAVQARAFDLSANAWSRITPEPTMQEQCGFMADYLLACLFLDPAPDGFVHSGFEAGHALAAWLKHLGGMPEASDVIFQVAKRLEQLFKQSDANGRNRIETGALEHILEARRLRRYFEHWGADPELREAYGPALAWGLAHEHGEPSA